MHPVYDFRCPEGHVFEARVAREVHEAPCDCGLVARRELAAPLINGIVQVPMRERGIPLNRMIEAHDTIVHQSDRAGVEPVDTLAIAKRRAATIRRHRPELVG